MERQTEQFLLNFPLRNLDIDVICCEAQLLSLSFLETHVLQDHSQVWLAGGAEQSARPPISGSSKDFIDGTYMVCFSDLWRCTEQVLSHMLNCSPWMTFYIRVPTWMLDVAKEIVCPGVAYVRFHPGLFSPIFNPHLAPFRREERASPPCPSRFESGLSWQPTPPSTTGSQACPLPQEGQVTWECSQWGVWQEQGPNFSSCKDPPTLEDHLANIATATNTAVVLEVTQLQTKKQMQRKNQQLEQKKHSYP